MLLRKTFIIGTVLIIIFVAFLSYRYTQETPKGKNILLVLSSQELKSAHNYFLPVFEKKGTNITVASTTTETIWKGEHGEIIKPKVKIPHVNVNQYDVIIIDCSRSESELLKNIYLRILVREANKKNKVIVATTYAPLILAKAGVLKGREATISSYHNMIKKLKEYDVIYMDSDEPVISDNIITYSKSAFTTDWRKIASAIIKVLEEGSLFEWALRNETVKGYKEYLKQYPEGSKSEEIRKRLESHLFDLTIHDNTIEGYEEYLKVFPEGYRSDEIRYELLEPLLFTWVKEKKTIQSYERYVKDYPNGKYVNEAKSGIEFCKAHKAAVKIIEIPEIMTPGQSYSIVFKETNGTGVILKKYNYHLNCDRGTYYTRSDPSMAESRWVKIKPFGDATHQNDIPKEWDNCYSVTGGWFGGYDDYGNYITVKFSYKIKKQVPNE